MISATDRALCSEKLLLYAAQIFNCQIIKHLTSGGKCNNHSRKGNIRPIAVHHQLQKVNLRSGTMFHLHHSTFLFPSVNTKASFCTIYQDSIVLSKIRKWAQCRYIYKYIYKSIFVPRLLFWLLRSACHFLGVLYGVLLSYEIWV